MGDIYGLSRNDVKYSDNSEEKHNSDISFLMVDIIFDRVA